jgi:hypothetical protein
MVITSLDRASSSKLSKLQKRLLLEGLKAYLQQGEQAGTLPLSKILRDFYSIGERIRGRRHNPVLRQKRLEQSKRLKGRYKSAARALKKLRQRGLMVKTPTGHWRLSLLGKSIAQELYPGLAEAAFGERVRQRRSEELARCEALIGQQSARRERLGLEVGGHASEDSNTR